MKIGPYEGTPEEIKNFFQDSGLQMADYLAVPEAPIRTVWFLVPGVVFVLALAVLTLLTHLAKPATTLVFLVGAAAALWLAVNAQLRFKNPWAMAVITLGGLLLLLVALGAVTPLEMLQEVKSLNR